jgi:hypothetical protein
MKAGGRTDDSADLHAKTAAGSDARGAGYRVTCTVTVAVSTPPRPSLIM